MKTATVPVTSPATPGWTELAKRFFQNPAVPPNVGLLAIACVAASEQPILGLLTLVGLGSGLASGLVGIGGGLITIPLLLLAPPFAGLEPLAVHTITGITSVQVVAAALAALGGHVTAGSFSPELFLIIGGAMTIASFAGAFASGSVDPAVLEIVFASIALIAAALLLFAPTPSSAIPMGGRMSGSWRLRAAIAGGVVGGPAGLVGVGGSFLEIPIMVHWLRVPMRVAIGTSLGIVALSASATLLGKTITGQVDWVLAIALVAGAVPGAQFGSVMSRMVPVRTLARLLGVLVAVAGLRLWAGVLL